MNRQKIFFLLTGVYFGFVLSRVGVSDFRLISGFFTGTDFTLGGVMLTAIVTAHVGMRVLAVREKTINGSPVKISRKRLYRHSLGGAVIFGIGWGISGACPGTVLVQIGEGKLPALFTFAGMVAGTWIYALFVEKNNRAGI